MMAQILRKPFQLAKQQPNVLGKIGISAKYSTITHDETQQLKTVNLASMKRGTGGRSSFNGMVVSIFGCTGFLGPYVAYKFGKIGSQMILCYRGDYYDAMRLKPCGDLGQVLFHFYNLRDEKSIRDAMKYSNVVVNLVGREWETNNYKFNDVQVDGARRIAKAAREMGVDRLIHLSAMNVSPKPEPIIYEGGSKFLKSKYYGELAVLEEFPNATIIRPADMYGQADHFLWYYQHIFRRHFIHKVALWEKGEKTVKAPVFGGDVAQAIVNAAKDPESAGKIYQGVGPHRYLLSEILDYMYRVMRKDGVWGYKRTDLRYNPIFPIKVWLNEKLRIANPVGELHRQRVEREFVSDVILEGVPTLEDLGVSLTLMENQVPWELRPYGAFMYYAGEPGEFPEPGKPKPLGKRELLA